MPNLSDHIVDAVTTHTINLMRVDAGMRAAILRDLKALQNDLVRELSDIEGKTAFSLARLTALLRQANETIKTAFSEIANTHETKLAKIAGISAEQVVGAVNSQISAELLTVGMAKAQLESVARDTLIHGRFSREWWSKQATNVRDRFAVEMRLGMLRGEGVGELSKRVRDLMDVTKSQAETLVRTSVQAVANAARLGTYLENKDVIGAIQWVSTLDNRTTPICIALDGKKWRLPESGEWDDFAGYEPIGHDKEFPGETAHWNCRSTQIPITLSWDELSGRNAITRAGRGTNIASLVRSYGREAGMTADEIDAAMQVTRASMDGQVAQDMTFNEWLKTKSDPFQNELLGTQTAELWRSGRITATELTDQSNRPLSLAQLQQAVSAGELIPRLIFAEGQGGLTLLERKIAEDSMVEGNKGEVVTTYYDIDTGERLTVKGYAPTVDDTPKIDAFEKLGVIRNTLTQGELWTPQELQYMASRPNFTKATVVGPNGRIMQMIVKEPGAFKDTHATKITSTVRRLKADKNLPATQQKFAKAISKPGIPASFVTRPAGTVEPPASAFAGRGKIIKKKPFSKAKK